MSISFENKLIHPDDMQAFITDLKPGHVWIWNCTTTNDDRTKILEALGSMLSKHPNTKMLTISKFSLSDQDLMILDNSHAFDHLLYLDLSFNHISNNGAGMLFEGHPHLVEVNMLNNQIGNGVADTILSFIAKSNSEVMIRIGGLMDEKHEREIMTAIQRHTEVIKNDRTEFMKHMNYVNAFKTKYFDDHK